jgi:ssDNA thymidine ADP-ribosyltransferase, DarT
VLTDEEMKELLNADKARIFRIMHRDNLSWIVANGVQCPSSAKRDANFVGIGNADLIGSRAHRAVPVAPRGTLSDYVPFYFTPFSPMAYNIKTGFNGIRQRKNEEILILVSSVPTLVAKKIPFLFCDRHAYLNAAQFSDSSKDLKRIDWRILQARDFKRDNDDLEKLERYQAEALVHKHLPISALLGVACYDDLTVEAVNKLLDQMDVELKVAPKPEWYFR